MVGGEATRMELQFHIRNLGSRGFRTMRCCQRNRIKSSYAAGNPLKDHQTIHPPTACHVRSPFDFQLVSGGISIQLEPTPGINQLAAGYCVTKSDILVCWHTQGTLRII